MTDFVERFWSFVDIRNQRECWPWLGTLGFGGYGMPEAPLQVAFGEPTAHRIACGLAHRKQEGRDVVLHSCDNGACCNPRHLRWGTTAENQRDRLVSEWALNALTARTEGRPLPTHTLENLPYLIVNTDLRASSVIGLGPGCRVRLNREIVREILGDHAAGMSTKELSKKYGLTHSHTDNIIKRRIWKDAA